jgi:hypothetical protein
MMQAEVGDKGYSTKVPEKNRDVRRHNHDINDI